MSLSESRAHWRTSKDRPEFHCCFGAAMHAVYIHIPVENVQPCIDPDCYCYHLDGWTGTCPVCNISYHICPWGCFMPIRMNNGKTDLEFHYLRHHRRQFRIVEFPIKKA